MSRKERRHYFLLYVPYSVEGREVGSRRIAELAVSEHTPGGDGRGGKGVTREIFKFKGAPFSQWNGINGGLFQEIHDRLDGAHTCVLHTLESDPGFSGRIERTSLYIGPSSMRQLRVPALVSGQICGAEENRMGR